jgi:hypothetical protein
MPFAPHVYSLAKIERTELPGPSAVVCMADAPSLLAKIHDSHRVAARLDLVFNDSGDDFGLVRSATDEDARRINAFVDEHKGRVPNIVFQCQVGIGRSLAAYAATLKLNGGDPTAVLHYGTHNRVLYRRMLRVAGVEPDPEPKVSLAVRVKYSPERMRAFLLSIERQRYDNWELVFVTDGPNPAAREIVSRSGDARVKLVETEKPLGRWGHPYRQRGIDACTGDYIGLSNDDNYYVPGYLEQMVNALRKEDALLAMCGMLHSYNAWKVEEPGFDLGSWIARADLVRRTPWEGDDFFYDGRYVEALKANAGGRIAWIPKPLFIHN